MTKEMEKVMALVEEMKEEEKKTQKVPHYYKRNGKLLRRSYDDIIQTERYKELFYGNGGIRGVKVFGCAVCGDYVDYFDYTEEGWCVECYERMMGDDL